MRADASLSTQQASRSSTPAIPQAYPNELLSFPLWTFKQEHRSNRVWTLPPLAASQHPCGSLQPSAARSTQHQGLACCHGVPNGAIVSTAKGARVSLP